jgi:hypothetical protein
VTPGGQLRFSVAPLPAEPTQDPTAFEQEVYKILAALYNAEEGSFWTRNNILMGVQGFLIAATANIVSNADKAIGSGANPWRRLPPESTPVNVSTAQGSVRVAVGEASRRKRNRYKGPIRPVDMAELQKRLEQIYAAVDDAASMPLEKHQFVVEPIIMGGRQVGIKGDWDIDMSEARLTNLAYSAIDTIAVFYNSMVVYGKAHGISLDEINAVTDCDPLIIIRNLHNSRKHPEMLASGSSKALELRELRRELKLGPGPIEIDFTPWKPVGGITDTGGAMLMIEGDIVEAASGQGIASFGETITQGLAKWEEFLHRHNLV